MFPITHEPLIIGLLASLPALVLWADTTRVGKAIFQFLPPLLFCYFVPSILQITGLIDANKTNFYLIATQYFLPISLILFGLSLDIRALRKLGKPAIWVFLAGVFGIVIGAPIALFIVGSIFPSILAGEGHQEIWKGLATIAGTWIGGAANQTTIKEILQTSDSLFALMAVVDVVVAYVLMAILLYGAKNQTRIDKWLKADNQLLLEVQYNLETYQSQISQPITTQNTLALIAIALLGVGIAHTVGKTFFWVALICTTFGILLSFLPTTRKLEGAGASQWATAFLYVLITALGTKLNLAGISQMPLLFLIAIIWILVHLTCLFIVARWLRTPFFFVAVGSQAAIGGVASAPVVASAFQASLAPVGVLLAVFGYAIGTYCALACAYLMQMVFIWLK
jgi:uncharacterized membrane protein